MINGGDMLGQLIATAAQDDVQLLVCPAVAGSVCSSSSRMLLEPDPAHLPSGRKVEGVESAAAPVGQQDLAAIVRPDRRQRQIGVGQPRSSGLLAKSRRAQTSPLQ